VERGKIIGHFILAIGLISVLLMPGLTMPVLQAQPYPDRPIQIVSPMGAGNASDVTARLFAEELQKILKTPILVVNKPGASMAVGTGFVAKGKRDGYTLLYAPTTAITGKAVQPESVPYDAFKDLEPLGLHYFLPVALGVQEEAPWKTFAELLDYAKKKPGEVRISSTGIATHSSLNVHIIETLTGAQFTVVPYADIKTVTVLLGGHVEAASCSLSSLLPYISSKKLRAILTSMKLSEYPHLPTIEELGYRETLTTPWLAFFAPSGIPEDVKRVLIPAIKEAINNPELIAKINKRGGVVIDYKSPVELRKIMMEDYEKMAAIAIRMGLRK
jgi:tripartite-type tricarboxylate transporter receptor subunit TctC